MDETFCEELSPGAALRAAAAKERGSAPPGAPAERRIALAVAPGLCVDGRPLRKCRVVLAAEPPPQPPQLPAPEGPPA
jgi:hypothetical protein